MLKKPTSSLVIVLIRGPVHQVLFAWLKNLHTVLSSPLFSISLDPPLHTVYSSCIVIVL